MTSSWQSIALQKLQDRHAQMPPQESRQLVEQCNKLWLVATKNEMMVTMLKQKLVVAKHEATELHLNTSDEKTKSTIIKLQEQANRLQAELNEKLKNERDSAKNEAKLSIEIRNLEKERDTFRECYLDSKSKLEKVEELKYQLLRSADDIKLLQEENARKTEETQRIRAEMQVVREEREAIVTRTFKDKQRLAEEFNEMTTKAERDKTRISALERQVQKLESQLSKGMTDSVAFGFESVQGFDDTSGKWVNQDQVHPPTKCVLSYPAHRVEATSVCVNDDATVVVTGSSDGTVKLWKPMDNQPIATLYPAGGPSSKLPPIVCVDIRGAYVVAGANDFNARVWSLDTHRVIHTLTGHTGKVYAIKLTPDCRMVVTGATDRKIMVWDMCNGYRLQIMSCGSMCNSIDVNEHGNMLASVHQDHSLKLWDLRAARLIQTLSDNHSAPITSVQFTKDSNRLLTCCKDGLLRLFDAITFQCMARFADPGFQITVSWSKATLSPDGNFVAAGSTSGTLFVWEVATCKVVAKLHREEGASVEQSTVELASFGSRRSSSRARGVNIESIAWANNGQFLAVCDYGGYIAYYQAR